MQLDELAKILEAHKLWRLGTRGSRANLRGGNLIGANLSEANLSEANLSEADLSGANLIGANLRWANLIEANLSGANLSGANLIGAYLREANLSEANLSEANLREANLIEANLSEADLREANLSGAYGIRHCTVGGSWHGEASRNLLCVELPDGLWFYCGCFRGQEPALRQYIADGAEKYRASRTRALELCKELMEIK